MKTLILTLMLLPFVADAAPLRIQLPVETAAYRKAAGSEYANAQCLICHSADYASMQPPKGRDFWQAEVEKMKGKYGAPIPADQVTNLVTYFAVNYGTEPAAGTEIAPVIQPTEIDAHALAQQAGCLQCHNPEVKIVGPAYKDVAAKYRGRPDGLEKVEHQITHGGSGQWGPILMPPFPQFTPDQVDALAKWVLSQ